MPATEVRNYWLFQAKPTEVAISEALRSEALATFPLSAHFQRVQAGDGVIIWQTGKRAGCYALARVTAPAGEQPPEAEEAPYWTAYQEPAPRVHLSVEYNFWQQPIPWEALRELPAFSDFHGGRPGLTYRATAAQYETIRQLQDQLALLEEPAPDYEAPSFPLPPVNLLLYGPPGTGKTYQTVQYALSIIEGRSPEELALEDRKELRRRFNTYLGNGQIAFVTFHQSFTYEDFVEGIKPITREGRVSYELVDGIFKLMALDARRCLLQELMREQPPIRQTLEFDQLYSAFLQYLRGDDFQFFETQSQRRVFLQRVLRFGNLSVRMEKNFSVATIEKNVLRRLYQHYPEPEAPLDLDRQVSPLSGGQRPTVYEAVFRELKRFEQQQQAKATPESPGEADMQHIEVPVVDDALVRRCRRYVLIIDEINRGNVPGIFGELITLLESDKREGRGEALYTVLPYSRAYFSVPANLFLVGTMNTADRAAAPIDLALRRRFAFHELPTRPELIPLLASTPRPAGVDLERMLRAINARLARLLDRQYAIGHAYLLEIDTLDELRAVFEQRLLPLLQAYFFDDYAKIGLVLGEAFVTQAPPEEGQFAAFSDEVRYDWREQPVYRLRPVSELTEVDFIRIYEPGL